MRTRTQRTSHLACRVGTAGLPPTARALADTAFWEAYLDIGTPRNLDPRRSLSSLLSRSHRPHRAATPTRPVREARQSTPPIPHGSRCSKNCWPWALPRTRLRKTQTSSSCTLNRGRLRRSSRRRTMIANSGRLPRLPRVLPPGAPSVHRLPAPHNLRDEALRLRLRQHEGARRTPRQSIATRLVAQRRHHLLENRLHPQGLRSQSSGHLRPSLKLASLPTCLPHLQTEHELRPT